MSEFFNVTLEKDIMLDDTSVKKNMTWSSEKILTEIVDKRLTKLEQLEDVDITNKKDKQVLTYSESSGRWTSTTIKDIGESAGGLNIKQVTKLGIKATEKDPHVVKIPINTIDFKVPAVNVLQYKNGDENIINTLCEFTNGEENDFEKDDKIIFDGKAHMKTEEKFDFKQYDEDEKYTYSSVKLNLNDFKNIESFDTAENGVINQLVVKGTPHDRLLIPKGDMNLSNVVNVDYFKMQGDGKNIKIIVSNDSGKTWYTFKNQKWIKINATVEDVDKNGISINTFNSINDIFWNELITNKKVRFAYLFKLDSTEDIEEIDKIELQYDGQGKWKQLKGNEFEVVYASNSLLEVSLFCNGDFKINY